jgi:hypothetical protein
LILTNEQFVQLAQTGVFKVQTSHSTATNIIAQNHPPQVGTPILVKTESLSPNSSGLTTIQTVPLTSHPTYAFQTFTTSSRSEDVRGVFIFKPLMERKFNNELLFLF